MNKTAQSVQRILDQKGIETTVKEYAASTRTAQDAAQAIGCDVAQIVKSLIFCTQHTKHPILVLASGPNRVDEALISQYVGQAIGKADADFTREVTGFAIGGIPPIGHKQEIETYIDEDLLQYPEVWAAAGTPNAVFSLPSKELIALTSGKVVKIHQ